jgi:periplasmic protein TonB
MHANKISKVDVLDILFAGRNKEYGAYDLRKTYNKRISIALIVTVLTMSAIFIGSVLRDRFNLKKALSEIQVRDISITEMKADEPPPPPPPPKPKLPPPPQIATIAFTPPKVVKDEEVMKPPPEVKQIEEAKVDVKTVAGTKDLGIISAPPVESKGTQIVAKPIEKKDDEDKIFTIVEIDASFPGGADAWTKYVKRAIEANLDEFTEADFGTCMVKFIVDKTGKVSKVEALTMKGTKLAEVATNIIRRGPDWVPAQQNGRQVNAYRLQPVILKNPG